jgi:hypothetical protein
MLHALSRTYANASFYSASMIMRMFFALDTATIEDRGPARHGTGVKPISPHSGSARGFGTLGRRGWMSRKERTREYSGSRARVLSNTHATEPNPIVNWRVMLEATARQRRSLANVAIRCARTAEC